MESESDSPKPGTRSSARHPPHWSARGRPERDEPLAAFVNSAMDAIISVDEHQRIVLFNPAAEKTFRVDKTEAVGQPLKQFIPERFHLAHDEHFRDFSRKGIPAQRMEMLGEIVGLRADGEEFPVEASISQVTVADSKLFTVVLRDITARKEAEDALRQSEERYRLLFDRNPDGVFAVDRNGRFILANPACEVISGYSVAELLAKSFADICARDELANALAHFERAMHEQYYSPLETALIRKDGRRIEVWVAGQPMYSAGRLVAIHCTAKDITKRKEIEKALRESREDLKRAQAVGQIGSWRLDVQRNVLTWSDETFRIFGIPKGTSLTYEAFLETIHPDDRHYVNSKWNAALRGEAYDIEHRIVVAGEVRWVREKAYLEFDNAGSLRGGFGIAQDVTDRKRAEEALRQLNETLEQQVAERTAVAEQRAQDLRRLAAKLSDAEHQERRRLARLLHDDLQQLLLAVKLRLPAILNLPMDYIEEHIAKMDELLQSCLDTSRSLTQELSPPILQKGTLAEIIEWLGQWCGDKHGLAVAVDVQEELPSTPEHLRVFLFQAVREMLLNVVKHSGKMVAQVDLHCHEGRLAVQIQDEGEGFNPAAVEASLERPEGFGLFNIRERLQALQGQLEIASSPQGGARFRMLVPLE